MSAAVASLLSQYLVQCPRCGKPAAVHLDEREPGTCVLVRFVCPDACPVDERSVLERLARPTLRTKEFL